MQHTSTCHIFMSMMEVVTNKREIVYDARANQPQMNNDKPQSARLHDLHDLHDTCWYFEFIVTNTRIQSLFASIVYSKVTKKSTTQIPELQTSKWGSRAMSLNMAHQRNSFKLPWCQHPHAAPDRLKFQPRLKLEHMFQSNVNNTKSIEILFFLVEITGNHWRSTGDHWSSTCNQSSHPNCCETSNLPTLPGRWWATCPSWP